MLLETSPEPIDTHDSVKTALTAALAMLVGAEDLGELHADGVLFTNAAGGRRGQKEAHRRSRALPRKRDATCYAHPVTARDPAVRPLKRVEYDQLVAGGAFERERVELIDGLVMRMPPHGPEHDGTIDLLVDRLRERLGGRARLRVQSAFAATDDAEPEPDVAVVPPGDYRDAHPSTAFLIIEVAVSSVGYDRDKAATYARAGVPEYWIVDVPRRTVEVHRDPVGDAYEQRTTHRAPESLRPAAFPDAELALRDLFRG